MVYFDHFEIHVQDSQKYVDFLFLLFQGGRYKKISDNNTYMFLTVDGIHIEVKQSTNYNKNFDTEIGKGVCLPCLRTNDAKKHITEIKCIINRVLENPSGDVYFFTDYEGVCWHIKDYIILDEYVNI